MRNATETARQRRHAQAPRVAPRQARASARVAPRGGAARADAPPTGFGLGRCLPAAPPPRGTHRGRTRATRPHVSDEGLEPLTARPTWVRRGGRAGQPRGGARNDERHTHTLKGMHKVESAAATGGSDLKDFHALASEAGVTITPELLSVVVELLRLDVTPAAVLMMLRRVLVRSVELQRAQQ